MASYAIRDRRSFLEILTRWQIVFVVVVLVLATLADDWFRWFLLGTVAMGGLFALLGRLGERELGRTPHRGVLEEGEAVPPRKRGSLYNPNVVRPYGPAGAYITAHPVGAVIAIGAAVILFAGAPDARRFLYGMAALFVPGVIAGILLWLRNR